MLLGNVSNSLLHNFTLELTTPMLSDSFRKSLVSMIRTNAGNIPLSMVLYDPKTKYRIDFLSRKFKVAVTSTFVDQIKDLGIGYAINL
jgi:hypothetical protein